MLFEHRPSAWLPASRRARHRARARTYVACSGRRPAETRPAALRASHRPPGEVGRLVSQLDHPWAPVAAIARTTIPPVNIATMPDMEVEPRIGDAAGEMIRAAYAQDVASRQGARALHFPTRPAIEIVEWDDGTVTG